ncbi:hypothetical protein ACNTMW_30635 [Planosporangium sp. 12N6]|uniref:hypothetical protein n=1 Tax=Planosporangium spinosum TaxID=3402278 RepID=UPI003CE9400A
MTNSTPAARGAGPVPTPAERPTEAARTPAEPPADAGTAPGWTTEVRREDAGLEIVGRWSGRTGEPASDGPRELVIRLTDGAAPGARQRGVTSGVLRRVERHLGDMEAEAHRMPSVGGFQVMVRRYLEGRLATLPENPRQGGDAYYSGLLDIFEDLVGRGHPEPVNALASAMGVPKDTLKTRLRVARQRRGDGFRG